MAVTVAQERSVAASKEHVPSFQGAHLAIGMLLRRSTIDLIFRVASCCNFLLK
jgi:hypothetical protein